MRRYFLIMKTPLSSLKRKKFPHFCILFACLFCIWFCLPICFSLLLASLGSVIDILLLLDYEDLARALIGAMEGLLTLIRQEESDPIPFTPPPPSSSTQLSASSSQVPPPGSSRPPPPSIQAFSWPQDLHAQIEQARAEETAHREEAESSSWRIDFLLPKILAGKRASTAVSTALLSDLSSSQTDLRTWPFTHFGPLASVFLERQTCSHPVSAFKGPDNESFANFSAWWFCSDESWCEEQIAAFHACIELTRSILHHSCYSIVSRFTVVFASFSHRRNYIIPLQNRVHCLFIASASELSSSYQLCFLSCLTAALCVFFGSLSLSMSSFVSLLPLESSMAAL